MAKKSIQIINFTIQYPRFKEGMTFSGLRVNYSNRSDPDSSFRLNNTGTLPV